MKSLKYLKNDGYYVLGVSGGPDSMALLDLCYKEGLSIVVAHVNYQKRDTALRDEMIVKEYCEKNEIPVFVLKQEKTCVGNFQAFARVERYRFYKELMDKFHGQAVLLAHHLDDHLETYMMQKQRKSCPDYYGIKDELVLFDCKIIRPLMMYTKQDLLAYCIQQKVPYGFDESNFSNDYTRNQIRHQYIDRMSRKEKEELACQIERENEALQKQREITHAFLSTWDHSVSSLCMHSEQQQKEYLRTWIKEEINYPISDKLVSELVSLLKSDKNIQTSIHPEYRLEKEYGKLHLSKKEEVAYSYTFTSVQPFTCPYFCLQEQGASTEALTLKEEDFPLTIRNALKGDEIKLRFGTKKLNRWFIDRKIPSWERRRWPVVVNAQQRVILVPQIGCDIEHFSNNPSIFVVK